MSQGFPVRAFVRKDDRRASALRKLGAEIYVGDLHNFHDLTDAMNGVQRAYHCPPFTQNLLHGTMLFALAAEQAKLDVVVLMSQWQPHASHPSLISRDHWITNNIYRWMPSVDVIHLNPGLFAFTYFLGLPAVKHFGMLMLSFGEGKNAPHRTNTLAPARLPLCQILHHIWERPIDQRAPDLFPLTMSPKLWEPFLDRKVQYINASSKMFSKAAKAQGYPIFEICQVRHHAHDLRLGAMNWGRQPIMLLS